MTSDTPVASGDHRVAARPTLEPRRRIDEIARRSLAQVRRSLRADAAQIQVVEPSRSIILVDLFDCALPGWIQTTPHVPSLLTVERTSLLSLEVHPDPARRAFLESAGRRRLAVTPLVSAARPLGSLLVARHESLDYTPDELVMLDTIGCMLGALMEEVIWFDRPSRRADAEEVLRGLAAHLVTAREEERARIAREIHDELGQTLTVLKMDLSWSQRRLAGLGAGAPRREIRRRLRAMSSLVDETIQSVRRIATELRPGVLDQLGLEAAIEWQAHEFETRTGIRCLLRTALRGRAADPPIATAVFRIFQETLTNVARHSNASRVTVRLRREKGDLLLEVRDNGRGIAEEEISSPRSIGLLGMRERALLLGGEVTVEGRPGRGAVVRLRIPLGPPALAGAPTERPREETGE